MTASKVEIITNNALNLASEDRSRGVGRTRRLLAMWAAGFVFLAACLLLVDVRRLDHLTSSQGIHGSRIFHERVR